MNPKLRSDLNVAASIVTLALGIVVLVGWIRSWPGSVMTVILFSGGVGALAVCAVWWASAEVFRIVETSDSPPPPWWLPLGGAVCIFVVGWIKIRPLAHPVLMRIVGGIFLGAVILASIVWLVLSLHARYRTDKDGGR